MRGPTPADNSSRAREGAAKLCWLVRFLRRRSSEQGGESDEPSPLRPFSSSGRLMAPSGPSPGASSLLKTATPS